ncbi:MAG: bifunctional oligoribonuclease/PAP phosphatase NrnA [Gemmatimonadales bacterium]|nr:MAG: bifunctional oligoribonuclease/PAP phosphatase NrnA [Gemmatimonadales bacterium]
MIRPHPTATPSEPLSTSTPQNRFPTPSPSASADEAPVPGPGYMVDPARIPGIETILKALDGVERVVLTTHLNADGDGTGSQAAMFAFLEARDVRVRVVNPTPFPDLFRFLFPDLARDGDFPILDASTEAATEWCRTADLVIVLDTGEIPRIGRVKPMVEHLPHLVIDHHPAGDRAIEGVAWREVGASATGEMVHDLIHHAGGTLNQRAVDGLYVAILTDTGSFRFSNATPLAHRVAAELIARGAKPDELHDRIYGSAPLRRYKLLEAVLGTLDRTPDGRVAWMTVPQRTFRSLGCNAEDLEGLTDYPRTLEGTEVALLFRPVDDGVKVSFRSNGSVDVNRVAREFGGGGHVRASGALVQGDLEKVRQRVVAAVSSALDGEGPGRSGPTEPDRRANPRTTSLPTGNAR